MRLEIATAMKTTVAALRRCDGARVRGCGGASEGAKVRWCSKPAGLCVASKFRTVALSDARSHDSYRRTVPASTLPSNVFRDTGCRYHSSIDIAHTVGGDTHRCRDRIFLWFLSLPDSDHQQSACRRELEHLMPLGPRHVHAVGCI